MKLELTLDKDRTMPVSEMRRVLAQVLSRLRGETEVTKLSFAITITPPQDTGGK
jgi:hypothetical protein